MTDKTEFVPREKPTIHLDQEKFIPFEQNISHDANLNKPFIPQTVEDALDRQKHEATNN